MTATVVTIPLGNDSGAESNSVNSVRRVRVIININNVVLSAEEAVHQSRTWLAENVSNLLTVATPELVVDEGLFWRFEVMLGLPNNVQPGSGALYNVGQIRLDAETGEVEDGEALAAELRVHVASIAP